jgi:1,4-dihydroxy-2-naphthoate phytyltransferase
LVKLGCGSRVRIERMIALASSSSEGDDGELSTSSMTCLKTPSLWWRALKLPMYSVAWMPVMCAASLVYLKFGFVELWSAGECFLGSTLVIAWLNLSNDAFDASTNVDETKPESVVNLLGGKVGLVHGLAIGALVAGAGMLFAACRASGNSLSWKLLLAATAMGYAYQGPPFRLSYKGLGEPIAFTAFGPLATVAFYIALCGRASGGAPVVVTAAVSSVAVLLGCTTAFILFTSHFHQERGDRAAGKMSPIVRLGLPQALLLADNLVGAHYAMVATLAAAGWLPYTAVFGLVISYPVARHIVDYAQSKLDENDIDALFFTKYLAVRWHVIHGFALALGVVAQRLFLSPALFIGGGA